MTDIIRLQAGTGLEVVHLPALVRGELIWPPRLEPTQLAAAAIDGQQAFRCEGAEVLCGPLIARDTLEPTSSHQCLVLPRINPERLVERDLAQLADHLYNLPFDAVLDYVAKLREL